MGCAVWTWLLVHSRIASCKNVDSTLIQHQDDELTLNRRCFNVVCSLAYTLRRTATEGPQWKGPQKQLLDGEWIKLVYTISLYRCSSKLYEPAHDKTDKKIFVGHRKDSNQTVHPPSTARVLVYPSFDSPEEVEGTCNQWRLWLDCADAQADLSLRWLQKSHCVMHWLFFSLLLMYTTVMTVCRICVYEFI